MFSQLLGVRNKVTSKKVISLEEKFIFKDAEQKCKPQTRCCYIGQVLWLIYIPRSLKVKFTLVQALRLCTGRTAHRGSTGTGEGKVHPGTGTEALYRPYGPQGE